MSTRDVWTDGQILRTVDRVRAREHACTIGALAHELGMSKAGCHQRVQRLIAQGVLAQGRIAGSLHPLVNPKTFDAQPSSV